MSRARQQSIPLARHDVRPEDISAVVDVLKSDRLSLGPRTQAFEKALAEAVGVPHAVAVNSGTSALHLLIRALDIGPGDEVITTPFSFIASTNCILFERATPVFVDIEPDTLCIDVSRVERAITPRTKAILAVDVFGHPARLEELEAIAKARGLRLIEDSAESLGSSLGGRKCGSFGDAAIFGFYPNKQITTGEGGAVVTRDADLAALCRSMTDQGRGDAGWLHHVRLGYNFRIDEMSAALGWSQLCASARDRRGARPRRELVSRTTRRRRRDRLAQGRSGCGDELVCVRRSAGGAFPASGSGPSPCSTHRRRHRLPRLFRADSPPAAHS